MHIFAPSMVLHQGTRERKQLCRSSKLSREIALSITNEIMVKNLQLNCFIEQVKKTSLSQYDINWCERLLFWNSEDFSPKAWANRRKCLRVFEDCQCPLHSWYGLSFNTLSHLENPQDETFTRVIRGMEKRELGTTLATGREQSRLYCNLRILAQKIELIERRAQEYLRNANVACMPSWDYPSIPPSTWRIDRMKPSQGRHMEGKRGSMES